MKAIRFRVWDKKTKKIRNVEEMGFGSNDWILPADVVNRKMKDVKLMQFTGLYDKNGEGIYENDIIVDDMYNVYYECRFSEGCFGFHSKDNRYFNLIDREYISKDIEIVGNIYENPELLNK